jgi:hypothetical protein
MSKFHTNEIFSISTNILQSCPKKNPPTNPHTLNEEWKISKKWATPRKRKYRTPTKETNPSRKVEQLLSTQQSNLK